MKKLSFALIWLLLTGCIVDFGSISQDISAGWTRTYAASWLLCRGADGSDLGDYDKDGDYDIATACEKHASNTPSVVVSKNDGDGTFTPFGLGLVNLQAPEDAVWWDEDNDTWLDLVVLEQSGKRARLFRNNSGTLSTQPELIAGVLVVKDPVTGVQTSTGTPMNGLPVRFKPVGPGEFWVGSYSTGAALDRWKRNLTTGKYEIVEHHAAVSIQEITDFDGTLLISDWGGAKRGVYRLDTGYRYTNAPYTRWHSEHNGRIVAGAAEVTVGYRRLQIAGVEPMEIPYPSEFSWYVASAWGDIDCDGIEDIMITGTHSTDADSTLIGLLGPDFTTKIEIASWLGIKHDNLKPLLDAQRCVQAIVTTEEKSEGVLVFFPGEIGPIGDAKRTNTDYEPVRL